MEKRAYTNRDSRTPHESSQWAHLPRCSDQIPKDQIHNSRSLTRNNDNRNQREGAQQVGVPTQVEGGTFDDFETLLDDDGMDGGDHGRRDTEEDTDCGDGCAVEEDADEEAEGD